MKSIWLENGKSDNKIWKQLLQDYGVQENSHKDIDVSLLSKEEIVKEICQADQICFRSSLVGDSLYLIDELIQFLGSLKIEDKTFYIMADFLDALNSRYILPKSWRETLFFNSNKVFELNDGKLKRIIWQFHKNKFEFV